MLDTPYCELIDDRVWNLIHNSFLQPQLLPPYLHNLTSLIGSFPNGFGEVCCQATEFYTLSIGSFGDEDSKSQCMPVANHKHAI